MTIAPIQIWPFDEAPPELQALSQNGGDEDWLATLPLSMMVPFFLEEGSRFGCCSVEVHEHLGRRILIGCHA